MGSLSIPGACLPSCCQDFEDLEDVQEGSPVFGFPYPWDDVAVNLHYHIAIFHRKDVTLAGQVYVFSLEDQVARSCHGDFLRG